MAKGTFIIPRGAMQSTQPLDSTASRYNERRIQPLAGKAVASICITKIDLSDQGTCLYFKDRIQPEASHAFASWRIVRLFPESYQTVLSCESDYLCDMIRIRYLDIKSRMNSYSDYSYPWIFVIFHAAASMSAVSEYILNIVHLIRRVGSNMNSTSTNCELTYLDIHRLFYMVFSSMCDLQLEKLIRFVPIKPKDISSISTYTHPFIFLMREGKLIIRIISWLLMLKNLKVGQIVIPEDPYI